MPEPADGHDAGLGAGRAASCLSELPRFVELKLWIEVVSLEG